MAMKAAGEDDGRPNVINLARARTALEARRAMFRWPADGPHPERVAAAALEATAGDAALVAIDGTVLAVNRRWLLGTPACVPGHDFFSSWRLDELDPRDAAQLITGVRAALSSVDGYEHDCELDGQVVTVTATSLGGAVGGAVLTVTERTGRHGTNASGRDPLTGLANRSRFVDRLTRLLRSDDGCTIAVLVVNLHDFKVVNQAYGHALGDQLLVEVGRRITSATGEDDLVAHLGGDEFAVLTQSAPGIGGTARLAMTVADRLAEPFQAGTRQVHLTASVGCRVAERALHESGIEVLRDAVAAMRDARHAQTTGVAFFTDDTRERVLRRMALENDLRLAVEHGSLALAFQPQVDLRTGAVHGVEALLRWHHDHYGPVPPTEFIPIAEAIGLIQPLGEWVLTEACREFSQWKGSPGAPAFVTVNLSPLQLTDGGLVPFVREVLAANGLTPAELCLELTEGALMSSPDEGIDALRALRDMGASIALDDFGTGYSSLGMLKALPVDVLKLDRAFVVGLGASEQDRAVVAAIMALAGALGLQTVAEGVEKSEQAECLLTLGCTVVQGWLYAPAVPSDEFLTLCNAGFSPVATSQIPRRRVDQALDGYPAGGPRA
ncbi:MAG: sensor-containing diguanylate cyclase/phosphodiesterase [Acidimicrobiales bacterium]|nr:sensor-containing diguanylate cyclase/phosphodiesterase [Acidimicrobiales bacterium]